MLLLLAGTVAWSYPPALPAWRGVGVVSAWAGSALLLASVVLMLREPRLARALGGLDVMLRWHHISGVGGYVLLLAHPLALALDAAQQQPARAWQVLAPWLHGWPVAAGWASLLLLMLGLAVTFHPRVRYRPWRTLHQALALAVVLGWVHVLALRGQSGVAMVGGGLAATALAWRLAIIDRGPVGHLYRIAEVRTLSPGVIEARLMPLAAAMRPAPGQFLLARFLDGEGYRACGEFHPFTVSGIGADGSLQVAIKALGHCTTRIQGIEAGLLVRLQGPFGHFLADVASAPQLWIAGGIGITPFIAALRQQPCARPTTLIYLHRSPPAGAFVDELRALQHTDPLLDVLIVPTGAQPPAMGPLLERVESLAGREVQVCGPAPLVRALLPCLRQRGVPEHSIHHESFDFR